MELKDSNYWSEMRPELFLWLGGEMTSDLLGKNFN